jgi:hypothetical protein
MTVSSGIMIVVLVVKVRALENLLFAVITLPLVYGPEITTCHYKGLLWVICQALLG